LGTVFRLARRHVWGEKMKVPNKTVAKEIHDKLGGIRTCSKCGKPLIFISDSVTVLTTRFVFENGKFRHGFKNVSDVPAQRDLKSTMIHDDCGKPLSAEDYKWFTNMMNW